MSFDIATLQPGAEVAIRTERHGHVRFYGYSHEYTTVTRITKARIFVRDFKWEGGQKVETEHEFNKSDLLSRHDGGRYRRALLLIDPVEIQAAREAEAAEKARNELESSGLAALATIKAMFDMARGHHAVENRSEYEIKLLVSVAGVMSKTSCPLAFEAARGALEALQATFEADGYPSDHAKLRPEG